MKRKEKEPKEVKPQKEKPVKEKKPKSEGYVMKKDTGMRALRILLWTMISFIFIRGVLSIFKPDTGQEARQAIQEFKENYNQFTNQNTEVMAFAQNFAREYLTYQMRGEADYKDRLKQYVTTAFLNGTINSLSGSAAATYVQAYRMEEYSADQMDVYVLAGMEYTSQQLAADGQTYTTETDKSELVLKVPVSIQDGAYVVENLPLVVTDTVYRNQNISEYSGSALDKEAEDAVTVSIENFLRAYCEQDASVINYYLAASADKADFTGLGGSFTFAGLKKVQAYKGTDADIIALVEFTIKDSKNGVELLQKINLAIKEADGRFYIESMDTRTGNLKIN